MTPVSGASHESTPVRAGHCRGPGTHQIIAVTAPGRRTQPPAGAGGHATRLPTSPDVRGVLVTVIWATTSALAVFVFVQDALRGVGPRWCRGAPSGESARCSCEGERAIRQVLIEEHRQSIRWGVQLGQPHTDNVDRIEILRGPAAYSTGRMR